MVLAVLELWYLQGDFFRRFFRFFFYRIQLGAKLFVGEYFLFKLTGGFRILVEPVVHRRLCFVDNPGSHFGISELVLRLAFEHGRLYLDRDSRGRAFTNILALVALAEVLVDSLEKTFLECRKMGSPVGSILAVYKGKIIFTIIVLVGKSELELFSLVVAHGIETARSHLGFQKIKQAVLGNIFVSVENKGQTGIEICVVPYPFLEKFQ